MGKKILVLTVVIILLGGAFWFLRKNDYQFFGLDLNLRKNPTAGKTYKIGFVMTGGAYQQALDGLKKGLSDKGYREGQNVVFLIRDTRGNTDALKPAIEELLA